MSENTKQTEKIYGSITIKQGLIIFVSLIAIGIVAFGIIQLLLLIPPKSQVSINDIDGHWNTSLTEYEYIFIPKSNIDGLEFTFSIRDKNNNELQQIIKKVGDVRRGQQYTVTLNAVEIKDFDTLLSSDAIELTVTGGTKKLI